MKTFLEFLKEYNQQLEEDAVMAAGEAGAASSGADAISPPGEANGAQNLDIAPPKAMNAMTDNSVLGTCNKMKDHCDGFLGKNDFHIPRNILSGDTPDIKPANVPKVLKRF